MTVITMSRNELTRLRVLIDVADGRLSVTDATGLIGVGRRQIYRLLQAFRADGADGLISRKRGGPSNRALGSVFRETVLVGTQAGNSVVNSYGQTHEIPNLYVAGPGIFTTAGASNPTYTILALSLRGAEQLA